MRERRVSEARARRVVIMIEDRDVTVMKRPKARLSMPTSCSPKRDMKGPTKELRQAYEDIAAEKNGHVAMAKDDLGRPEDGKLGLRHGPDLAPRYRVDEGGYVRRPVPQS